MPPTHPRRGFKRRGLAVGVAVAVAVSAVACSSSDVHSTVADQTSAPSSNVTLGTDSGAETTVVVDDIPPGAVTLSGSDGAAIAATVSDVDPASIGPFPAGFTPAGGAVDIIVAEGAVTAPLTLSMPGIEPPGEMVPVFLHRNDAGLWEPDPATYANGTYTADVSTFSLRLPGWLDPRVWLDNAVDWLTGRTDPPADCSSAYQWVAVGTAPADGTFHACARNNPVPGTGVERVEVVIKSNRSVAMWITMPAQPYDFLWVEGVGEWTLLAPVITEIDQAFGDSRVLLPPGRTMTVGYTQPVGADMDLLFTSSQTTTTQVVSLLSKYLGDAAVIGGTVAALWCMYSASVGENRDARLSELGLLDVVTCLGKFVAEIATNLTGSLLDITYRRMVNEGRFYLSTGAADGIEQLIGRAETTRQLSNVAAALKKIGSALLAAQLLSDATSMIADVTLGFTPGLNSFNVTLAGSPEPIAVPQAPVAAAIPNETIQLYLNMLFYGPLDEDGILGPASTEAIQKFQTDNALDVTGQPDQRTVDLLVSRAGDETFLVDGCGNQMPPRTDSLYLTCSLSSGLVDVQWQHWTAHDAIGTGRVFTRSCDAGCVNGEPEYTDVTVEAFNPERWRCGDSAPYQIFTFRIIDSNGQVYGEYPPLDYSC
jgi:Putative peptidoglycan binding domain